MGSPRWHKILADLRVSRSRTILVILSIAIGVFAVGTMLTSRIVLQDGIEESFDLANPASAVLTTDPLEQDLVDALRALPEISDAEARTSIAARLQQDDDSWRSIGLSAIANFEEIQIDRIIPESGAWPPATGELVLERLSADDAGLEIGDAITIETADGSRHTLTVTGLAYDPGQVHPSIGDGSLAGYITRETVAYLEQPTGFNDVRLLAAEDPRDLRQGEFVAALARDEVLEPGGATVNRIAVHDSPRYHSALLGDALILILGLLGVMVLVLGMFLVINTITAVLAHQARQIGMMKAVGGTRGQIAAIYLLMVLAFGLMAVIIAVPLSALGASAFSGFFGNLLNIDVSGPFFPPSVVAIQLAIGLLLPLLAAIIPVLRDTRITVRQAITSYGLGDSANPEGMLDRFLERLRGVPRPVMLSLRNTFRRRGRLVLTLSTLVLGGAIFASVLTINASLGGTFDQVMRYTSYDVVVSLRESVPAETAISEVESLPGVEQAEGWIVTNAARLRPDGTQNSNIRLTAAPTDSDRIRPTLLEGRWLQPGETDAVVINVDFKNDEGDINVGDTIALRVQGQDLNWPVVGVVTTQLMGPVVFAPYESTTELLGIAGEANQIVLVTDTHDAATQSSVAERAEEQMRAAGLPVIEVETESAMRDATQSIFNILVILLLVVGGLLVVVGSLGLTGAMSLNVIERTREIGVMRAIGASNGQVAKIVVTEGLVVGLLGWLLASILSLPMSWALSYLIGVAFVQSPLEFTFSIAGILLWLIVVLVLSVVASLFPARNAWRLSVREVLAYE
ncbi:MAG: ABC transporter permease [Sphaerobacteraceae bacterium]|nr:MAG: ABC transporter permease [Sphaerobacteraceae bacterium]